MKKAYFFPFANYYKEHFLDQDRIPDELELRALFALVTVLLYKGTVWQFMRGAGECGAVRAAFGELVLAELEKSFALRPVPSHEEIVKLLHEEGLIGESGTAVRGGDKHRQRRNEGGAV